jgi:hypothetical protein
MVLADGAGTVLAVHVEQARPAEVRLLGPTLKHVCIGGCRAKGRRPKRLIVDRGYDRNTGRALLLKRATDPIITARRSNTIATLGCKTSVGW